MCLLPSGPSSFGSLPHPNVPGTSNSSRPLFSAGSGWGNQDSSGGGWGSSGGGVGIRGGGRMCRSLDTWEGRVTSPPCRKDQPGGVTGCSLVGRKVSQVLGRGTIRYTYPEELLELGAVVERGDMHSEAKQVLSPLSPLFDHRGFEPTYSPQTKGQEEKQ